MAMFDKILEVFFEDDTEARPRSSAQTGATKTPAAAQTVQSASRPFQASQSRTDIDDAVYRNFHEVLQRAIEAENLPGFDFYEFQMLFKKFHDEGKSEQEAIQTALTSAETMRVDKNSLISHYQHYVKVMEDQQITFEKDLKDFLKKNINNPKAQAMKIDQEINDKIGLIQQYQNDVETLKQQKQTIGVDVEKAENQVESVKAAFSKAYEIIREEFENLYQKLKSL